MPQDKSALDPAYKKAGVMKQAPYQPMRKRDVGARPTPATTVSIPKGSPKGGGPIRRASRGHVARPFKLPHDWGQFERHQHATGKPLGRAR